MEILTQDELYTKLVSRLESGSPFTTASAAWQGYECVGAVDGAGGRWTCGINIVGENGLVFLSAFNRYRAKSLPRLPLAYRLARGKYRVIITRQMFDYWAYWLSQPAPVEQLALELGEVWPQDEAAHQVALDKAA